VRIKANHILYVINALTLLLILIITFLSDNVLRIILGLPFVLFFPGYALLSALFPRKGNLNDIERFVLDFGLSLAIVPLIGLALNYTSWGITLNSMLISLAVFVAVTSIVAWFRQWKLPDAEKFAFNIGLASWGKRNFVEKILSIILVFVILGTIGVVVYTIAVPKTSEKFSEFYVLNSEGKGNDYPVELNLGDTGKVTLGIANREQQDVSYKIETKIYGVPVSTIGPIILKNDEKYEAIATFIPQEVANHQKVEFLLFKNESLAPYMELHIWVDVK
jgi:uncharacterized membrane protein